MAVYLTGGMAECGHCYRTVARYSVTTDKWIELPSMDQARALHSSCVVKDRLFVFGGSDGHYFLD